jgi:hypothetical protein
LQRKVEVVKQFPGMRGLWGLIPQGRKGRKKKGREGGREGHIRTIYVSFNFFHIKQSKNK